VGADQDTSLWRDKCRAEYLKELARCIAVRASGPHAPYRCRDRGQAAHGGIRQESDCENANQRKFVQHMDAEQRTIYLNKGIVVNHPQAWRQVQQFQQMRVTRSVDAAGDAIIS